MTIFAIPRVLRVHDRVIEDGQYSDEGLALPREEHGVVACSPLPAPDPSIKAEPIFKGRNSGAGTQRGAADNRRVKTKIYGCAAQ